MQAQGYRIAENHRLVGVPPERVSEEWKSGGAGYWLDIQGDCHEVLEQYLGDIEIDPILLQLCDEDIEEIARVIPTDGAIFFGLPVSTGADDEPIGYLSALCLPRLLITLHPQPLPSLQEVADMLRAHQGAGRPDDLRPGLRDAGSPVVLEHSAGTADSTPGRGADRADGSGCRQPWRSSSCWRRRRPCVSSRPSMRRAAPSTRCSRLLDNDQLNLSELRCLLSGRAQQHGLPDPNRGAASRHAWTTCTSALSSMPRRRPTSDWPS